MSKAEKLLEKVFSGSSDHNLAFTDLCYLLTKLGAKMRTGKGSDVLSSLDGCIINLQNQGVRRSLIKWLKCEKF